MLDIFQQFQIEQNRQKTNELESEVREGRYSSQDIEERISKLSIVTQAVWSFLKETQHLDDIDLLNKIEQIDLEDGVKDGKVTAVVTDCPACNRRINTRYRTCLYCGELNPKYSPFTEIS